MRYKVKAAVLEEFGSPFRVREVELEAPDDWVLVDVKSVGVCGRDVVVWRGRFANLRPPLILGHEVFGEYKGRPVAVFPAIVGEECIELMPGRENLCREYSILGENVPGGYASSVAVPKWNLIDLPDSGYDKYAAAACGVATLMHSARRAGVGPGDKVLVTGASGGVGVHGIQYLRLIGAEVYAYTRSPEKARVLRELGAKVVDSPDFYRREGRMDAVMEIVGAATINWSMRTLKPGGTLVLIGNVGGDPVVIERPALLVMRELTITGTAAYTRREYEEAIRLIGEGLIKPFYRTYKLEEINKAYEDMTKASLVGRAVLNP